MIRILFAVAAVALGVAPAQSQERTGRHSLERARQRAAEADSFFRGYVQFLGLRRAYLGVNINTRSGATDSIGALIHSVSPNGPADKAGIQSGDIITTVNGQSLLTAPAEPGGANSSLSGLRLIEMVARLQPNDTVAVELRRGGSTMRVTLVTEPPPYYVRSWQSPDGRRGYAFGTDSFAVDGDTGLMETARRRQDALRAFREGLPRVPLLPPLLELEVTSLNPDLGEYFGSTEGILVISAPARSALGLRGGDVVLAVDGRKPTSPGHLLRILGTYETDEGIRFTIMRNQRRVTVTGTVEKLSR